MTYSLGTPEEVLPLAHAAARARLFVGELRCFDEVLGLKVLGNGRHGRHRPWPGI